MVGNALVSEIDGWLAKQGNALVAAWREACAIPSVSGVADRRTDLDAMARWVEERVADIFDRAWQMPVPGHAPVVAGRWEGGSEALLLYSHYDVQPAEPIELWESAPFDAIIRDGALIARGACDDKADVVARLHAFAAWRELRGKPPCTLIWLCEGAEEIGSPHLAEVLAANRDEIRAAGCLWESYLRRADGRPEIAFGCKGLLGVRLRVRTLRRDAHSAYAAVYRSAAHRLVKALATLVEPGGAVSIDGFGDDIRAPDDAELSAAVGIQLPPADAAAGADSPYLEDDPQALAQRLMFTPTANIAGLAAGHVGETLKTVLPAEATAVLDLRLVPDQRPERVAAALRAHLDVRGFDDLELEILTSVPPSRSPMTTRLASAVVEAARMVMGEPVLVPLSPGTGPLHIVAETLGTPIVCPPGTTRPASGIHAPNERGRIDDFLDQIRFTFRTLERLAADGSS